MITKPFTYKRASSVSEALSLLKDEAKPLAGGHSLIPAMKLRLDQPETLVDISRIDALRQVRMEGNTLVIGAGVTHATIASHQLVKNHCPLLAEGAEMIGDVQVRNKGTIGGSMAHNDPAADWPGLIIAADATVKLESAGGSRTLPASDFFIGFYMTALEEGELITEIHVPKMKGNARSAYRKFMQPASRYAIVGCGVVLEVKGGTIEGARVALNGVADRAYLDQAVMDALNGKPANSETISSAAALAAEGVDILSDHYASEKYRKHLAKVYVKRALEACL